MAKALGDRCEKSAKQHAGLTIHRSGERAAGHHTTVAALQMIRPPPLSNGRKSGPLRISAAQTHQFDCRFSSLIIAIQPALRHQAEPLSLDPPITTGTAKLPRRQRPTSMRAGLQQGRKELKSHQNKTAITT